MGWGDKHRKKLNPSLKRILAQTREEGFLKEARHWDWGCGAGDLAKGGGSEARLGAKWHRNGSWAGQRRGCFQPTP